MKTIKAPPFVVRTMIYLSMNCLPFAMPAAVAQETIPDGMDMAYWIDSI